MKPGNVRRILAACGARGRFLIAAGCAFVSANCLAFGIAPITEDVQAEGVWNRVLRGISNAEGDIVDLYVESFRTPVHEEITGLAYECNLRPADCNELGRGEPSSAPKYVLQGVQWNDNPPLKLRASQLHIAPMCAGLLIQLPNSWPGCWGLVFGAASQAAAPPGDHATFGPEAPILQRSHFGDMQFLHAMAPDDEAASETKRKIMAWAHFAYDVSIGQIAPTVIVSSPAAGSGAQFFPSAYYGMDVNSLFTLGTVPHTSERVRDMAFGSLLHTIEDSFSKAHVERESPRAPGGHWPGRVLEFHAYAHQDHRHHATADDRPAFENEDTKPFVIEAVRRLVAQRSSGSTWTQVEPLLEQLFDVAPGAGQAGPGKDYRVELPEAFGDGAATSAALQGSAVTPTNDAGTSNTGMGDGSN